MKIDTSMKLTQRDKKLLSILIVFVIIVAFVFLAIRPLTINYLAMRDQMIDEKNEQQINEAKEERLTSLQEDEKELNENLMQASSDYYEVMQSDEVDHLLTSLVMSQGLVSKNLEIVMPTEKFTIDAYEWSGLAQGTGQEEVAKIAATYELAEEEKMRDTEDSTEDSTEVSSEQSTEESAPQSNSQTLDTTDMSGILAVTATMTVQGEQEKMESLINTISEDYPAIRITSYSWDTDTTTTTADNLEQTVNTNNLLKLGLEIYMYEGERE